MQRQKHRLRKPSDNEGKDGSIATARKKKEISGFFRNISSQEQVRETPL